MMSLQWFLLILAVFFVSPSYAQAGCVCAGQNCSCCVQIKVSDPNIDVPACVNISYNPQALSASVIVEVDNKIVYNEVSQIVYMNRINITFSLTRLYLFTIPISASACPVFRSSRCAFSSPTCSILIAN